MVSPKSSMIASTSSSGRAQFSVENAGTFDADSEMKIWISGQAEPLSRQLKRGANVEAIQKALASIL